jgi:hypothetical protein
VLESFDLRVSLKELYEKDFYLWMQENLRLLEEKKV